MIVLSSKEEPATKAPQGIEWGIDFINAPEAWAQGATGAGIVVSSVDSGTDYTHPALVNQYRGNNGDGTFTHDYNWYDAYGDCASGPCDLDGHGTHTMGTMVGDDGSTNQVGVAPGAKWIAAKGCESGSCCSVSRSPSARSPRSASAPSGWSRPPW